MAVWCRKPKNRVLIYSDQGGAVHQQGLGVSPKDEHSEAFVEPARQLP
jgi:hypothetical protein